MRIRSRSMLAALVLTVALAPGLAGTAEARDRRCYGLEDELARLSSLSDDRRGGAEVRQWDEALNEAAERLAGLERRARRAHCDGGGFLFSSPDPRICEAVERDIADVRARMARLSRNRTIAMRRSGGGRTAQKIAAVRKQLSALRCNQPDYRASSRPPDPRYPQDPGVYNRGASRARPDRNGVVDQRPIPDDRERDGLFGMLFGGGQRYRGERDDYYAPYEEPGYGTAGGTYRTLCVRRCDGFFFPISFSTTEDRFFDDAQQCQAMCPGTSAELFVHRNPGEDASAMVSLDGTPYTDLQNAFRYRTEFDADCTCKSANMSVAGSNGSYNGNMTPLSGGGSGRTLNSSGSDPANSAWDGDTAWNADEPWNPDEPWDMDDPWNGYRDGRSAALRTDTMPMAKLSPDEDPDTVLNERGAYVPKLARITVPKSARAEDGPAAPGATHPAGSEPVRRVGPKYFVAQ